MQKRVISLFYYWYSFWVACTPKDANTSEEATATEPVIATDTTGTEGQELPPIVASGPAECRPASMFNR